MKQIVMITKTQEAVTMGSAGRFKTGEPVAVDDDALADALLKRRYPEFKEVTTAEVADEPALKAEKKTTK